jgi:hypothetical protein
MKFDEFLKIRRKSACVSRRSVRAEYGQSIDISLVMADPEMTQLVDTIVDHAMLTNGLRSFRAEHYRGDCVNAVTMARLSLGMPLQDSVHLVSNMVAEAERQFIRNRPGDRRGPTVRPSTHVDLPRGNGAAAGRQHALVLPDRPLSGSRLRL